MFDIRIKIAVGNLDFRDELPRLALFNHSAIKLNLDPEQLFTTASQYAVDQFARELVSGFQSKRTTQQISLEEWVYKEINGQNGIIYQ